ncbi:hypothetical protein C0992_007887, partial [Termitomyces sp. T32_za158]
MARKGTKVTQQLPPGLNTRASNKSVHPAAAAGLLPKPRTSRAEAQEKHKRLAQEQRDEAEKNLHAQEHAAEVEDALRHEDLERELTADRPPHSLVTPFKPVVKGQQKTSENTSGSNSQLNIHNEFMDSDQDRDEDYTPPPAPEEEDSNLLEDDDVANANIQDQQSKQARIQKPRRDDISRFRETNIASGTGGKRKAEAAAASESSQVTSKKKKSGKSHSAAAFNSKWLESSKARNTNALAAFAAERELINDDSLVMIRGFLADNEDDEVEQAAAMKAEVKPQRRQNLPAMVKIVPTKHVVTLTELRGGKKKWNLNHLPSGTSSQFTSMVIPLVKEKAGTLAPWATLSTPELQSIIDAVYKRGTYVVKSGDVWHGLVSYRLQSWRNGFATAACNIVKEFFEDKDNRDLFDTAEARCLAVQWWLDWKGEEGKETAPYLFRKCVDGEDGSRRKRGFCESSFIVHTFARAHLSFVRPPEPQGAIKNMPIGALILALQAVEHALKEYEKDAPVKNLQIKHWERILHDSHEVLLNLSKTRRRKTQSLSRASSEAESVAVVKEFTLVSDSNLSDDKNIDCDGDCTHDSDSDSNNGNEQTWQSGGRDGLARQSVAATAALDFSEDRD